MKRIGTDKGATFALAREAELFTWPRRLRAAIKFLCAERIREVLQ